MSPERSVTHVSERTAVRLNEEIGVQLGNDSDQNAELHSRLIAVQQALTAFDRWSQSAAVTPIGS